LLNSLFHSQTTTHQQLVPFLFQGSQGLPYYLQSILHQRQRHLEAFFNHSFWHHWTAVLETPSSSQSSPGKLELPPSNPFCLLQLLTNLLTLPCMVLAQSSSKSALSTHHPVSWPHPPTPPRLLHTGNLRTFSLTSNTAGIFRWICGTVAIAPVVLAHSGVPEPDPFISTFLITGQGGLLPLLNWILFPPLPSSSSSHSTYSQTAPPHLLIIATIQPSTVNIVSIDVLDIISLNSYSLLTCFAQINW